MNKPRTNLPRTHRGFALAELLALLVVAAVLVSVLLIAGDRSRRAARLGEDLANLSRIGAMTQAYAADFEDYVWSLSWKEGPNPTHWPDLQESGSSMQAVRDQAVALMRDLGDRADIPRITGWVPSIRYSHLVLADYSGGAAPARWAVSAGDRNLLKWAHDPSCFDQGCFNPHVPHNQGTEEGKRWPYSSSFTLPIAFFDRSPVQDRIAPGPSLDRFLVPGGVIIEGARLSDIAHPSGKVMLFDQFTRHFGPRQPVFLLDEARIALLMSDGSAAARRSAEANRGAHPSNPGSPMVPTRLYFPSPHQPPAVTGDRDMGPGRYKWTRMDVRGRDFGGPEVWP